MTLDMSTRTLARLAILPLDFPPETREQVFTSPPSISDKKEQFKNYVNQALRTLSIEPEPAPASDVADIIRFAAFTPIRIQHADPFTDTQYLEREPPGSAERRMLKTPLQKHPGLSFFDKRARLYYLNTILDLFENAVPPELQAEIAAVLLTADPGTTPENRAYGDTDPETLHEQYKDRITITDIGIEVPRDHITRACQLPIPKASRLPYEHDPKPYYVYSNSAITIPWPYFRSLLGEYAWHGWTALVATVTETLTNTDIEQLKTSTPGAKQQIYDQFKYNRSIYRTVYGTENTSNPQRKARQYADPALPTNPLQIEDKRLLTVVDAIRADPELAFDEPIPLTDLFTSIRTFFPAPHRPGNDIASIKTLFNALNNAASDNIKLYRHADTDDFVCTIPKPEFNPVLCTDPPAWEHYRHILSLQRNQTPSVEQITPPNGMRQKNVVSAYLP